MKMRLLPSSYWATPSIWSQHLRVTHNMLQELQTVLWTDYHFSFLWRPHPCQGVICPSLLLAHSSDDLWEAHNGAGWWGGGWQPEQLIRLRAQTEMNRVVNWDKGQTWKFFLPCMNLICTSEPPGTQPQEVPGCHPSHTPPPAQQC